MSSKKIARTREVLERLLREQLQFIEASADSFDRGFEGEAKRLATTIRVLCHDTTMSRSLLGQLDLKGSTRFPDTAEPCTPPVSVPFAGLVMITTQSFEKGSWYIAPLDDGRDVTMRSFEEWWNGAIFVLPHDQLLSRFWLVTTAANQDGGAHVDPELDERYQRIFDGLGWESSIGGAAHELNQIELVSLRQIAHELLKALLPAIAGSRRTSGWSSRQ
jgi:hypothetical protein